MTKRERRPSRQMIALLDALSASRGEWQHGYPLMKATGLSSGTLYPLLMRMTEQGLVESEWQAPNEPGRPPRHAYRLTSAGRTLAAQLYDPKADVQPGRTVTI
ncbi:PadR family transcriptional regulator [Sphingomonas jaspsi]|uniref:PadR family transcriptional regulator n=1 Tax=Sphingomonas jaspsi TaxID=392409 RepID=UPI001FE12365|nr:helix-turn-helix transcriptional regulator [Sphingomonas jaspsi]